MRWWQQLPYSCPTSVALVLTTPFSPLSSQRINQTQTQTQTLSPHLPTRASLPAWTHSSSIPALSPLHLAAEAEMFPSKKIWFFLFVTWFRCSMPTTTSLDCLGNLSLSPYIFNCSKIPANFISLFLLSLFVSLKYVGKRWICKLIFYVLFSTHFKTNFSIFCVFDFGSRENIRK